MMSSEKTTKIVEPDHTRGAQAMPRQPQPQPEPPAQQPAPTPTPKKDK
jgi:hypothetical protein